jgi:hypothetical protein
MNNGRTAFARLLSVRLFAYATNTLKIYGFSQNCKFSLDICWYLDFVKRFVVKVKNFLAPYTLEMLVVLQICIKPLGIAGALDDKGCANFTECQEGPVDGIQGYIWQRPSDLLEEHFRRGVLFGSNKGFVDLYPLGGNL